jgi:hypothetical protein
MKGLRKKILLDVFVTPWTIIPAVAGASMLMLSEAIPILAFPGFLLILVAIGAVATNAIFNLEKISSNAVNELLAKDERERNKELDRIQTKLSRDNDSRDETYLRDLRRLYTDFKRDVQDGKISRSVTTTMLDQIEQVFKVCVHSLEQQYDLLEMSRQVNGDNRKELIKQREDLLREVGKNVEELANLITQVRTFKMRAQKMELQDLQGQLKRSLEIAKQLEAFTTGTSSPQDQVIDQYAKEYLQTPQA